MAILTETLAPHRGGPVAGVNHAGRDLSCDVEHAPVKSEAHVGWKAELALWFAQLAGKTRLVRRHHFGPLMVQSPFHPEKDGTCHVYLLHPPGGVAGGDHLDMNFHVGAASRVLMTTPGAAKFYRSETHQSRQSVRIDAAAGSTCEYFPQESIVFDGARAVSDTCIDLTGDARYAGWEISCLGRPAAGESFRSGHLRQSTMIMRDGRLIWFERSSIAGGSPLMTAPHALAGHTTWGTFLYAGPDLELAAERVRAAVGPDVSGTFSVSALADVVVCRYLGPQASEAKAQFVRAWGALRILCQGKPASPPRIWAT